LHRHGLAEELLGDEDAEGEDHVRVAHLVGDEAHNPYLSLCFTMRGTGCNTDAEGEAHVRVAHQDRRGGHAVQDELQDDLRQPTGRPAATSRRAPTASGLPPWVGARGGCMGFAHSVCVRQLQ
jgi:hypothetical protein